MTRTQLDRIPNDILLGKYRLLATLGQGGMGTVYLALASGLGAFRKLLVVKELRRDLPHTHGSLTMFMDEARLLARLDHPNVVQTFEVGEDRGRYFVAMEFLDGQPLHKVIERARTTKGRLELKLQIHILCEILNGLKYAHELRDYDGTPLGVVHRDISPQNVFVTYHGQIKLLDFGVAKAGTARDRTSPGVFKGKVAYAAPEQLLSRPIDGRTDVFSVGVMLWEAIAGRRLVTGSPTPATFTTRTEGREPRIEIVVPDVDPALATICNRALEVDVEQRYPTAEAFREDLMSYLTTHDQRMESGDISTLMSELFERDRRMMHQIVERAMGDAGATHSTIQSVAQSASLHAFPFPPAPPPSGHVPLNIGAASDSISTDLLTSLRGAGLSPTYGAAPHVGLGSAVPLNGGPNGFNDPNGFMLNGGQVISMTRHATPSGERIGAVGVSTLPPAPHQSETARRWFGGVGLAGLAIFVFMGTFQLSRACNGPRLSAASATDPSMERRLPMQQPARTALPLGAAATAATASRSGAAEPAAAASSRTGAPAAPAAVRSTKTFSSKSASRSSERGAAAAESDSESNAQRPATLPASNTPSLLERPSSEAADEGNPMGTDLRRLRGNGNLRIDLEDPYK